MVEEEQKARFGVPPVSSTTFGPALPPSLSLTTNSPAAPPSYTPPVVYAKLLHLTDLPTPSSSNSRISRSPSHHTAKKHTSWASSCRPTQDEGPSIRRHRHGSFAVVGTNLDLPATSLSITPRCASQEGLLAQEPFTSPQISQGWVHCVDL